MSFPDACVQTVAIVGDWWIQQESRLPERGSLIFCFVPHADQIPYTFVPIGRTNPTEHDNANVRVAPLKVDQPLKQLDLPVAAMPNYPHEVWAAYRAKKRPCLVLSAAHPQVEQNLTQGKPKHATAPMMLIAPYFGIASSANRAGYSKEFVDRVVNCYYPQFMFDCLPFTGGEPSILRLDQVQPVGRHYQSHQLTGFRLCDAAIDLMDTWLKWVFHGSMPAGSLLATTVQLLQEN